MKKVIRLTESDLMKIVKRVINEQKVGDPAQVNQLPKKIQDFVKKYFLTGKFYYASVNGQLGITFTYVKGNLSSSLSEQDIETYESYKSRTSECQKRSQRSKELRKDRNLRGPDIHKKLNQEFPNMGWCGVVSNVQNIINMK